MRLNHENMNPSEIEVQKRYADLILAIGDRHSDNQETDMLCEDEESGEQAYRITNNLHFTNQNNDEL